MPKEREGYREMLEILLTAYPGRVALKVEEAAAAIGVHRTTITDAIRRRVDPLPAQRIGNGKKYDSYIIPITGLARWACAKQN